MDRGAAPRGARLVDVALRAGVSIATASRVLNGPLRDHASATAERVREAGEELGYCVNANAQGLVKSSSGLVGAVVADIADARLASIAKGIQQEARECGRTMLLAALDGRVDDAPRVLDVFAAYRAEATIIALGGLAPSQGQNAPDDLVAVLSRTVGRSPVLVLHDRLAIGSAPAVGIGGLPPEEVGRLAARIGLGAGTPVPPESHRVGQERAH